MSMFVKPIVGRSAPLAIAIVALLTVSSSAGATEWYTGRKPVAQAPTGLFSWAKPLPPSDDWIIGDAPKAGPSTQPAADEQAKNYQALAITGPKTPASEGQKKSWIIADPKHKDDDNKDNDDDKSKPDDKDDGPSAPEKKTRVAWDSSFGMSSRNSLSYNVGMTATSGGTLEKSGARFHVEGQMEAPCCIGHSIGKGPTGAQYSGAVMVGYEWISEKASFGAYLGMNMQNAAKYMLEVSNSGAGIQAAADFSLNPSDRFTISGSGTYSTLNNSYYTRGKFGFAIFQDVFVGPEMALVGENTSRQRRFGGFISGITIRNLQFGISSGYAIDSKHGNGVYTQLDIRASF